MNKIKQCIFMGILVGLFGAGSQVCAAAMYDADRGSDDIGALVSAIKGNDFQMVLTLIENGADIHNCAGMNLLDLSCGREVLNILVARGINDWSDEYKSFAHPATQATNAERLAIAMARRAARCGDDGLVPIDQLRPMVDEMVNGPAQHDDGCVVA